MRKQLWLSLTVLLVPALLLGVSVFQLFRAVHLPEILQPAAYVIGQSTYAPGAAVSLRIILQDVKSGQPLPETRVVVGLRPQNETVPLPLYEGTTDASGRLEARFVVPDNSDPRSVLVVQAFSPAGEVKVEQPVAVERAFKLLLSTDKPIYQPGQTIHIRTVTFDAATLAPAVMQPVELTIADARGNKVLRRSLLTSAYGVAAVDFTLADEVNTGVYKIVATCGATSSEVSVTVEPYVLPKFRVTLHTERPYYLPGETVRGSVQADYFFGKPVSGKVELIGYTFDVQWQEALHLTGESDAQGTYAFEFDLPPYLVAGNPDQQLATFLLEAQVKDGADHVERVQWPLPVAQQALVLEAVPESGTLVPGVENIIYLMAATPDGLPVTAELTVQAGGQSATLTTNPAGLAEWRFIPETSTVTLALSARDSQGRTASRTLTLTPAENALLLRPERALYTVGETLKADIFAPWSRGVVYLDLVREGQLLNTQMVEVENGHATLAFDLDPNTYGTLELHAYALSPDGTFYRDTRLIVVEQARDLEVTITPGQEVYAPGDTARLNFTVSAPEGGVPAVLGVMAVDEAVYALQQQDPGFLKLYFLLEAELLQPRYDLHGWTLPAVLSQEQLTTAQDQAAQAALAPYGGTGLFMRDTRAAAQTRLQALTRTLQSERAAQALPFLYPITLVLPLATLALALGHAQRQQRLLPGLGLALLGALGLFVLGRLILTASFTFWFDEVIWRYGLGLLFGMAFFSLVAWIALLARSLQRGDLLRGLGLGLLLIYMAGLVALGYAVILSGVTPPERLVVFLLVGLGLTPLAYLLWASGDLRQHPWWTTAANVILALGLIGLPLSGIGVWARRAAYDQVKGLAPLLGGMELPVPQPLVPPTAEEANQQPAGTSPTTQQPPRLRQNFGETWLWIPELLTNDQGQAELSVPLFDNITTWRITALAHTQDGRIGSATAPLRVFQDFFVDFDVPYALTQGDEVSLLVAVYNYLDTPQELDLVLESQGWFVPLDGLEKTITVAANDVTVERFRVRVTATQGRYRPVVWAYGERMSDATTATHDILIRPNGKAFSQTWSTRLSAGSVFTQEVMIPEHAIQDTARLDIKVYPGAFSQLVEGMDAIFQMPYGCFEQTSSTTYPNVLALDYLHTTGQETPEIRFKAEQYINLGYQRLTTFEVEGGGFSLFGEAPADRMLTAYGLMEFSDMARVYPVDPDLVERAATWLLDQQAADGSWENDRGLVHETSWQALGNDRVPVTAYITWALLSAGYGERPEVQTALAYLRAHHQEVSDPYALALVANALVTADAQEATTQQVLERLIALAHEDETGAWWESRIATMTGARDRSASLETTALAVQALLKAGSAPGLSARALDYLVRHKEANGTWGTTQATILALKALLLSTGPASQRPDLAVTVGWNGLEQGRLQVTPETCDVVQGLSLNTVGNGLGALTLTGSGTGEVLVQVTASWYLPWEQVPAAAPEETPLSIIVTYDRTALQVEDTIQVKVHVRLQEGQVSAALVDLGLPPGFTLLADDLQQRIAQDQSLPAGQTRIARYELTGRQLLVYLQDLLAGQEVEFSYRLKARFPLRATIPAARVYDYYNPTSVAELPPQTIEVKP